MKRTRKTKKKIEIAVYGVIHCSCGDSHLVRHGRPQSRKQAGSSSARRD
jgi:hypothetical protein